MSERRDKGWHGDIWGNVPVQGDGTVDGHPWYFRSRGEHAHFAVHYLPDGDPVEVGDGPLDQPGFFVCARVGEWPEAGWIDEETAWGFVERGITLYRWAKAHAPHLCWQACYEQHVAVPDELENQRAAVRLARLFDVSVRSNMECALAWLKGVCEELQIPLPTEQERQRGFTSSGSPDWRDRLRDATVFLQGASDKLASTPLEGARATLAHALPRD